MAITHVQGAPCRRGHTLRFVSNGECVECRRASGARYRKNNHAKVRARAAEWYAAHPDKYRAWSELWRKANPDKVRAMQVAHRTANRERVRASAREWGRRNRAKVSAGMMAWMRANTERHQRNATTWKQTNRAANASRQIQREARKKNAPGGGVSPAQWQEALDASLGICTYCNQRRPLTMDHIEPLGTGGAHDTENVTAVCKACNSSKRDTTLVLWLAKLAHRKAA